MGTDLEIQCTIVNNDNKQLYRFKCEKNPVLQYNSKSV